MRFSFFLLSQILKLKYSYYIKNYSANIITEVITTTFKGWQNMKKFSVVLRILTFTLVISIFSATTYFSYTIPDKFYIENGSNKLNINSVFKLSGTVKKNDSLCQSADLTLMGWLPVKTVNIESIERPTLIPCGTPFGIKMLTDGVIITDFGDVKDKNDVIHSSPGETSGLLKGDIINEINGDKISSATELYEELRNAPNETIEIEYTRDEKTSSIDVKAIKDKNGQYKLGLWVRDSAAGIGTMTFYDPYRKIFGGLGHGVCDMDSGKLLPLQSGEIVPAIINNIVKGKSGAPGELCGTLIQNDRTGKIISNTTNGILGYASSLSIESKALPIALKQEIKCGDAYILSTINGDRPEKFNIKINSVNLGSNNNKNMVIEITDKRLLDNTGGIVQGMSGSPIIQNDMLVGAVTHVFVNEPTKGYGIFIENMLSHAE
ncbi:MAG: SpoIVB peptidase [Ruminococcaceae bacterium]|nr:SpoIVB peptidase [Oscillospiraceae bacterium]